MKRLTLEIRGTVRGDLVIRWEKFVCCFFFIVDKGCLVQMYTGKAGENIHCAKTHFMDIRLSVK